MAGETAGRRRGRTCIARAPLWAVADHFLTGLESIWDMAPRVGTRCHSRPERPREVRAHLGARTAFSRRMLESL